MPSDRGADFGASRACSAARSGETGARTRIAGAVCPWNVTSSVVRTMLWLIQLSVSSEPIIRAMVFILVKFNTIPFLFAYRSIAPAFLRASRPTNSMTSCRIVTSVSSRTSAGFHVFGVLETLLICI